MNAGRRFRSDHPDLVSIASVKTMEPLLGIDSCDRATEWWFPDFRWADPDAPMAAYPSVAIAGLVVRQRSIAR